MKNEAPVFELASQMQQLEIMQLHVLSNETIKNYAASNFCPIL